MQISQLELPGMQQNKYNSPQEENWSIDSEMIQKAELGEEDF